jgi:hypothetical protein
MKPYGALTLGFVTALIGAARSWAAESWDLVFAVALLFAVASIGYAVVILRMRYEHRRRSRWNREHPL